MVEQETALQQLYSTLPPTKLLDEGWRRSEGIY